MIDLYDYNFFGEQKKIACLDEKYYFVNVENNLVTIEKNIKKPKSLKNKITYFEECICIDYEYLIFLTIEEKEKYFISLLEIKKNNDTEKQNFYNDVHNLIIDLEQQLIELKNICVPSDLLKYKKKYVIENKLETKKQEKKIESIKKCKQDITHYFENHTLENFKLKNMLYDLKINNKTFYNYNLDEFVKQFL